VGYIYHELAGIFIFFQPRQFKDHILRAARAGKKILQIRGDPITFFGAYIRYGEIPYQYQVSAKPV
jgi:hypothetical protein